MDEARPGRDAGAKVTIYSATGEKAAGFQASLERSLAATELPLGRLLAEVRLWMRESSWQEPVSYVRDDYREEQIGDVSNRARRKEQGGEVEALPKDGFHGGNSTAPTVLLNKYSKDDCSSPERS
jgi:hypothetical protein